jgi:hypothetical protein
MTWNFIIATPPNIILLLYAVTDKKNLGGNKINYFKSGINSIRARVGVSPHFVNRRPHFLLLIAVNSNAFNDHDCVVRAKLLYAQNLFSLVLPPAQCRAVDGTHKKQLSFNKHSRRGSNTIICLAFLNVEDFLNCNVT